MQRGWATEDFNIGQQRMGIQQQWAQEDIDRAIPYSSGEIASSFFVSVTA